MLCRSVSIKLPIRFNFVSLVTAQLVDTALTRFGKFARQRHGDRSEKAGKGRISKHASNVVGEFAKLQ